MLNPKCALCISSMEKRDMNDLKVLNMIKRLNDEILKACQEQQKCTSIIMGEAESSLAYELLIQEEYDVQVSSTRECAVRLFISWIRKDADVPQCYYDKSIQKYCKKKIYLMGLNKEVTTNWELYQRTY